MNTKINFRINIKKLFFLNLFFITNLPCYAHFTEDVVSYAMSEYLHKIANEKKSQYEAKYEEYITAFITAREIEINQALQKKATELNALPPSLTNIETNLQSSVSQYNNLLMKKRALINEQENIREQLNALLAKENQIHELKIQVNSIFSEVNNEIDKANEYVETLKNLHQEAEEMHHYYNNQGYMVEPSMVLKKEEFKKWQESMKKAQEAQLTSYNNQVEEFQSWKANEQKTIEDESKYINSLRQDVEDFIAHINQLVSEYNTNNEKNCVTRECNNALIRQKKDIEAIKQDLSKRQDILNDLSKKLNQRVKQYKLKQVLYLDQLDEKKNSLDKFNQSLLAEQERKKEEWQTMVHVNREQAKQSWETAYQAFMSFEQDINDQYGEDLSLFMSSLSDWVSVANEIYDKIYSPYKTVDIYLNNLEKSRFSKQ